MEKHDIPKLEKHIKELTHNLNSLANNKEFDELLTIIHKPGWTSIAEFQLASAVVDSMMAHTRALTELKTALMNASRRVGEAKSAGA
jgi:hypothetical protein